MKHGFTISEILKLRREHPEYRLREIAQIVGVTKQRVSQALIRAGLRTRGLWERKTQSVCVVCGKICQGKRVITCSDECKEAHYWTTIKCSWCFNPIRITKKRLDYCNRLLQQTKFYDRRECFRLARRRIGIQRQT